MNQEQLPAISVIEPISSALEKVKNILFKPFEINKWFTIGFCAWLAFLGRSGVNFRCNLPFDNMQHSGLLIEQVQDFFSEHFSLIILLGSIGVLIGLAITVILLWLGSRGRFMFLHCIVENKAEVKIPWHKFREPANSLFVFKLISGFIAFVCLSLCAVMIILSVKSDFYTSVSGIFAIVCLSLITFLAGVIIALFFKFTNDFIIPIMYLRFCSCTEAWRQFIQILLSRKGAFAVYILFQIVIVLVISAILMVLIIATCCCAALLLAIPYIGTVLMLPLLIFKRAYSLCYLSQFGPSYDVFLPVAKIET